MNTLTAYHGSQAKKDAILAQLQAHHDADEIIQGVGWEYGKGCAVGCTLHAYDHAIYEGRFGIPQMLAELEDAIFESLPDEQAKEWPLRFMGAIEPGADLSRVGWKFLHWLITDETVSPGINDPSVAGAVRQCAEVLEPLTRGESVDRATARAASLEARAVTREARVRAAAWAAEAAVWWASEDAEAAAAWAAEAAADAAAEAAWSTMADKLIELIEDEASE